MLSTSKSVFGLITGLVVGFFMGAGFFYVKSTSTIDPIDYIKNPVPKDQSHPAPIVTHTRFKVTTQRAIITTKRPHIDVSSKYNPTSKGIFSSYKFTTPPAKTEKPFNVSEIKLPMGLARIGMSNVEVRADMSPANAEDAFYRNIINVQIKCDQHMRLGRTADGGWDACLVPPFSPSNPCLVYSFGINNDWSFDDAVSTRYNCTVRAFDPSMKVGDHKHSSRVFFYQTGIGGMDTRNAKGWKIRTLQTLLNELGDSTKTIDYLKMDVEYSEWDSLKSILETGVLKRVKQFGFEIHTSELLQRTTSPTLFTEYYNILHNLEKQGFRKWYTHFNHYGKYISRRTMKTRSCCHEMVYINMNFFRGST